MNIETKSASDLMAEDLAKSGLSYQDIMARTLDEATKTATKAHHNTKGYVIPYFNIYGKLTQFYRVKVIGGAVSYLQIANAPNHVYFPKNFVEVFDRAERKICLFLEGEKKAALCCKHGIPAVAFGGVDSWRNRTLILPKQSEQFNVSGALGIKLPSADFDESTMSPLALGLQELLDVGLKSQTTFFIVYDSDSLKGVATGPQRAAARLGYEMRYKGYQMSKIRQLIPPHQYADKEGRTTVEDIILHKDGGVPVLLGLINSNLQQRVAFPRHPGIREHIAKQLQKPKLDRKQAQNVSLALLTEMDAKGTRMYAPDDLQMYYFNGENNHLMKVDINKPNLASVQETEFGMLLYKDYSISMSADSRLIQWLGSMFAGEDPVEHVTPFRILGKPKITEDVVRLQINNGQYIKVSGDPGAPYVIMANGAENTLFESQNLHIGGIDPKELTEELKKRHAEPIKSWWKQVIREVRLKNPGRQGDIIALLYYLSPYLLRWRGMQLPVEIITGEAGSGKSTLCEIRLNILTGDPKLRNTPKDQKDWYAALANCGGMTVIDNVQMTDKNLRQSMSDEMCRLVTELDPRIQIRKYFTEADERSIRVNSTFGFTAIQAPFQNGDLLQRAITLELTKATSAGDSIRFDSTWKDRQLAKFGGRTAWLSHQMHVLHMFFQLVKKKWDPNYQAKHRLVHFEQSLMLMAEVFGEDGSWIPDYLSDTTDKAITNADWAMEGLLEFADMWRMKEAHHIKTRTGRQKPPRLTFTSQDIANWAGSSEEYEKCFSLSNSRSLGRYLQANKYNIAHITGITEEGTKNNRVSYVANAISHSMESDPPSSTKALRDKGVEED